MGKYDYRQIEKKLQKKLDADRYRHTLGVMYTSAALAMAHRCDVEQALLAGLLHDCAKCISDRQKILMCQENHVHLTDFEVSHPFLIHAKLGAFLAENQYGIDDEEILSAIASHTTGKPDMSALEMIVYIADYIEPERNKAFRLNEIRELAFQDLEACMYEILKDTLDYLESHPKEIDQTTVNAFNFYKDLHIVRTGGILYE